MMKLQLKEKSELKWFHRWYWYAAAFLIWLLGVIIIETKGGGIDDRSFFYTFHGSSWFFVTLAYGFSFFKRPQ